MNIGQMMRAFLSDTAAADPKTLELKVGQIVKGLVLQLLSEQDAMVNIAGVTVKARLETPLRPGQPTLLQVQPESAGGQVVLKPLGSSDVPIPDDSVGILLKTIGLPDQDNQRQAAKLLHMEGAPVTKETVQDAAQMLKSKPAHVPEGEWKQTIALAVKKGLPVTAETVGALRQTLYGQPMHKAAAELGENLRQQLQNTQQLPQGTAILLQQTADKLTQLGDLSLPFAALSAEESRPLRAGNDPAETATVLPLDNDADELGARTPASRQTFTQQTPPTSAGKAEFTVPMLDEATPTDSADGSPQAGSHVNNSPKTANPSATATNSTAQIPAENGESLAKRNPEAAKQPEIYQDATVTVRDQIRNESAPSRPTVVQTILKLLGVDHEHTWSRLLQQSEAKDITLLTEDTSGDHAVPARTVEPNRSIDSLKGLLLQMTQSADMPSGLKEPAQQLLQQITGNQLLMTPDRNAPFTHVTLMLPIVNPDTGGQTAAVHIQSRRGKNGGLDAHNCRLLFDLQMKTIGSTLVDVRVVDRMVSLEIHNDYPVLRELIENNREEIIAGLQQAGYQLLTLKSAPFPQPNTAKNNAPDAAEGSSLIASRYRAKPYKGMDIRV